MKRFCLLLLSLTMVVSLLAGCGQPPETNLPTTIPTTGPTTSSPTTTPPTTVDPAINKELFAGSDSYEHLLAIIKQEIATGQYQIPFLFKTAGAPERSSDSSAGAQSPNGSYSTTNVQVAGVDEADIVKTDGRYLYYLANNRLYIVDAASEQPKVIFTKYFNPNVTNGNKTSGETPSELFLDVANKRLVVVLTGYMYENTPVKASSRMMMPYYNQKAYTITRVYEIADPTSPKLVRQFTQEGHFLTARMIDGFAYVLSSKYSYTYRYYYGAPEIAEDTSDPKDILPKTSDDPLTGDWNTLPADRIGIIPGADPNAQLIISAISVTKDAQKPELLSLVGASGVVYASTKHIYIANYVYDYNEKQPELSKNNMKIYRIGFDAGKLTANGTGTVPGTIINQFAMDEHNGYFRIATTDSGAFWGRSSTESSSTVYVLDGKMKTVGQVGKLGPGETIRSVRFMGDRAYVVTFQTTDPLYVLDLTQPTAPKVLGELKIPGFSTYLHPYGENLLLGFGFDAVVDGNSAYQTSLKVSLFDISDLKNPKERSTILLGGLGSYTELAYNHKALLFSKQKNLIAFPATLTGENASRNKDGGMLFQGLVILQIDDDTKLTLRGGLTNAKNLTRLTGSGVPYEKITKEDQMAISGYDSITRGLFIDDRLITLSGRLISQYSMESLKKLGTTQLKGYDDFYQYGIVYDDIAVTDSDDASSPSD